MKDAFPIAMLVLGWVFGFVCGHRIWGKSK
jgi:hypothetical protein